MHHMYMLYMHTARARDRESCLFCGGRGALVVRTARGGGVRSCPARPPVLTSGPFVFVFVLGLGGECVWGIRVASRGVRRAEMAI